MGINQLPDDQQDTSADLGTTFQVGVRTGANVKKGRGQSLDIQDGVKTFTDTSKGDTIAETMAGESFHKKIVERLAAKDREVGVDLTAECSDADQISPETVEQLEKMVEDVHRKNPNETVVRITGIGPKVADQLRRNANVRKFGTRIIARDHLNETIAKQAETPEATAA